VADTSNVVDAPTKISQSQIGEAQEKSPDKMKLDVAINGQDDFSFCSTSSNAQKNVRASVVTKGSNIRKSIQNLGKLINTSEKR
jgi:PleD family two-component response regulator